MKKSLFVFIVALALAGCSTYQGGTSDPVLTLPGTTRGVHSETSTGATYKPGMDLRNFDSIPRNTQGDVIP